MKGFRLHFQERMAGSGRLSFRCMKLGMQVAFPVDYRYGWNLADPHHQSILATVRTRMGIKATWWAPTCTPWSQASRGDAEKREAERQAQQPTLEWIITDIQAGQHRGEHAALENPNTSEIWDKSCLRVLPNLGMRQYIGDHCPFGQRRRRAYPEQN